VNEPSPSLFDPQAEHDACGVGFIATTRGPSHEVLRLGLSALGRLAHRGAAAADAETGDGAGVLTQVPQRLFAKEFALHASRPREPEAVGVGVFFLPQAEPERARARLGAQDALHAEGLDDFVWRPVPVDGGALGRQARASCPVIEHLLVARPAGDGEEGFERRLYRVRRRAEADFSRWADGRDDVHVVSFSARTMVYKGLMLAPQLGAFYGDLRDPEFGTAAVIYHQRYSTNTTPSWRRAQPFRLLAHNGEINTLQGNVSWMRARERVLRSPYWESLVDALRPVCDPGSSDSGILDNVAELLHMSGRNLPHVMMMLVPEAWEGIPDLDPARRDFYRYHAGLMEPWDGPAALVFGDGRIFGAGLDRNGLRPLRYTITDDGWVAAGSEIGAWDFAPERVIRYGKLGPGQILCVDLAEGRILESDEVKDAVCASRPYGAWLADEMVTGGDLSPDDVAQGTAGTGRARGGRLLPTPRGHDQGRVAAVALAESLPAAAPLGAAEIRRLQRAFSYTHEDTIHLLRPMVEHGKEAVGSMGDDTPHAVFSSKERPLFHYFKQRFAEVTNPPIDHLREDLVFSLRTLLGPRPNLLEETPAHAHLIELASPVLLDGELGAIRGHGAVDPAFRAVTLDTTFVSGDGPEALEPAVESLCAAAVAAVDAGAGLLVLSDRGVDAEHAVIPILMAVGAVHHHLLRTGRRMRPGIIAESAEPREVHHLAALLAYGANAINPYLALASIAELVADGRARHAATPEQAQAAYRAAAGEGLKKVMSKMGISGVASYTGAQIFEAVGVDQPVIDRCFAGTPSRFGGNGFVDFGALMLSWHAAAFPEVTSKPALHGFYRPREGGETHEFTAEVVDAMHAAVRAGVVPADGSVPEEMRGLYRHYLQVAERQGTTQLRHLLQLHGDRPPVPLDRVEPASAIVRRFSTGSMSLGSLSPEAHENLAIAMNRLGARSGSGEGGEDPARFGTEKNSAIKQVASGRFGVTPAYLASAAEIQIKMAQGSKPGEGGQIPGNKVTDYVARIRHTTPGVALISPPPHHDIYSIEDLAQLIYDLKRANPHAEISVKLVSQSGVGVIAAGVVKGHADIILISGHSGGTGSSPLSSIKNAGLPWELGLAETQQTLIGNGLRDRVALRVDGGLKTGRDVVLAALLGADEFSFGTAAMIAEGCIMMRICHTDNCPVGVASQKEGLRKKFPGTPEHVMNYFLLLAHEVREILAGLGYERLDQVIGRVDLLRQAGTGQPAADRLDLRPLLAVPAGCEDVPRRHAGVRNALPEGECLDDRLADLVRDALAAGRPVALRLPICNRDRAVGARLAFEIAGAYGFTGLPAGTVQVRLRGDAGQSFGAFLPRGVRFELQGSANDYVGKGLAGGEIVLRPDSRLRGPSHEHVLLGNTVLYGATGGTLYAAGRAGERFAVRNSGATAVVEGVGDHGCEYMTGGRVVILGTTGYNFAAGMTGGEAFVVDLDGRFRSRLNPQLVHVTPLLDADAAQLRQLLAMFAECTGSERAAAVLRDWPRWLPRWLRVAPRDEVRELSAEEEGAASTG